MAWIVFKYLVEFNLVQNNSAFWTTLNHWTDLRSTKGMNRAPELLQQKCSSLASTVQLEKQQKLVEVSAAANRLWQTTNKSVSLRKTASSCVSWTPSGAKPLGFSEERVRRPFCSECCNKLVEKKQHKVSNCSQDLFQRPSCPANSPKPNTRSADLTVT